MEEVQTSEQENYLHLTQGDQGYEKAEQIEGCYQNKWNNKNSLNNNSINTQNQNGIQLNQFPSLGKKTNSYEKLNTIKVVSKVNQPGFKQNKLTESLIKQAAIDQKLNKKTNKNDQQISSNKQFTMHTEPDERDRLIENQKIQKSINVKINPFFKLGQTQQQKQQNTQANQVKRTQNLPRSYSQAKINQRYHTQPNDDDNYDESNFQNTFQTQQSQSRKKLNNNNSTVNNSIPTRSRVFSSADYRSTYYSDQNKSYAALKTSQMQDQNSPEIGQTKFSKVIQFFIDKYNTELEEKKLLEERIQDLKRKLIQENQKLKMANYETQQLNGSNMAELYQQQRIESELIDIHRKKQYEQEKITHYEQIIQQMQVQNELILMKIEDEKKLIKEAELQSKVLKRRSDSQFKQKIHVKKQRNFSLKQISHREFKVRNLTNFTQTFQKDLKDIMQQYE